MSKYVKTFEKYDFENEKLSNEETKILKDFVEFLPDNFPDILKKRTEKSKLGTDGVFFMMLGEYIDKYGKNEDKLMTLTISTDEIFNFLDNRYGEGSIEW